MRKLAIQVALGFSVISPLGCSQSQDDIRKYAIRRPKDDDDTPSQSRPAANPPTNAGASANAVATAPPTTAQASAASPTPSVAVPVGSMPQGSSPASASPATASANAASGPLSDTIPPGTQWSAKEQRGRAIENLKRVANALQQYQNEKGIFPAPAIASADGRPLLSWRVELLPYLGYGSLAAAFHRDEPWDSPHNQTLLAHIPSVYQSPERLDERTNLLVPIGNSAAFHGVQGRAPRRWEDGLSNILLLLEVDNELAVPWTAPQDWTVEPTQPLRGLGTLRGDGFFAAWADSQIAMIPTNLPVESARAMFTVDGGESFNGSSVSRAATADPPATAPQMAINSATAASQVLTPQPTNGATAFTLSASGSSSAVPSASQVASFQTQALEAQQAGAVHDAMALAMASFLIDPSTASAFPFQWIPGLKRPALALRYGIAVTYSGSRAEELTKQLTPSEEMDDNAISAYESLLGDLGTTVLTQVRAQAPFVPMLLQAGETKKNASPSTTILPVGMGQPGELRQAALRDAMDVLLHFEVEERRSARGGTEATTISLNVIDVWTGQALLKSSRINYLKRERGRSEPLFVDPVEEVARDLDELLAKRLRPRAIPSELRSSHAEKRVQQLAKIRRDHPLPMLCEIKFYRDSNLITASQALAAFQALVGQAAGTELLAGTQEERYEALRPWLPRMKSYVAQARAAASDEEDD